MNDTNIRTQWVTAILEGRLATAEYLAADLPSVDLTEMVCPPEGNRAQWGTQGELCRP